MGKLLPIILVVLGFGGGVGAGKFLQPEPPEDMDGCGTPNAHGDDHKPTDHEEETPVAMDEECHEPEPEPKHQYDEDGNLIDGNGASYATIAKQFVIPILKDERVSGLVVAAIAIEVDEGQIEAVFGVEPKLRDAFLSVMFVHASSGGFRGNFLDRRSILDLKERLNEVARPIIGEVFHEVLLTEIARQDF